MSDKTPRIMNKEGGKNEPSSGSQGQQIINFGDTLPKLQNAPVSIPDGMECSSCGETVSKHADKCLKCGHPVSLSIKDSIE